MEGLLKQQCISDEGLYTWQKKYFRLNAKTQQIEIYSPNDQEKIQPMISIPIHSIQSAKEWSFSSALGGYGFDLLWYSGKVWSFLVEKENECNAWVDCYNKLLKQLQQQQQGPKKSEGNHHKNKVQEVVMNEDFLQTINAHKEFLSTLHSNSSSFIQETTNNSTITKPDAFSPVATSQEMIDLYPQTFDQFQQVTDSTQTQLLSRKDTNEKNVRYGDTVVAANEATAIKKHVTLPPQFPTQFQPPQPPLPQPEPSLADLSTDQLYGSQFHLSQHRPPIHPPATHPPTTYDYTLHNISAIPNSGSNADSESDHSSNHGVKELSMPPYTPVVTAKVGKTPSLKSLTSPPRGSVKTGVTPPTSPNRIREPKRKQSTSPHPKSEKKQEVTGKTPPTSPTGQRVKEDEEEILPRRNPSPLSPPRMPSLNHSHNYSTLIPPPFPSHALPPVTLPSPATASTTTDSYVTSNLPAPLLYPQTIDQQHQYPSQQQKMTNHHFQNKDYMQNMKNIFEQTKNSLLITENELNDLKVNNDVITQNLRIKQLESMLTSKDEAFMNLQTQFHENTTFYQKKIHDLQEEIIHLKKQEDKSQKKMKEEMASKVLRASNEHALFYESQVKSLKIQHQQEIQSLRDELQQERQRHKAEKEKEAMKYKTLRIEEESIEQQYRHLEEKYDLLQTDYQHLHTIHQQSKQLQQQEKDTIIHHLQDEIKQLQQEKLQTIHQSQELLQQQLLEKTHYYEDLIENMKQKEKTLLEQEMKQYYLNQLELLQKQYQDQIITITNAEKSKHLIELERVNKYYENKDYTINQDIQTLESLHKQRIEQYEKTIKDLYHEKEVMKEHISSLSLSYEKKLQDSSILIKQLTTEITNQLLIINALDKDKKELLEKDHTLISNEQLYRNKLIDILQENKIIKLEKQELLSQITSLHYELKEKTIQLQEILNNTTSQDSMVRIQKEEIIMLEKELSNEQEKLQYLKEELLKYERIIYGVAQQKTSYESKSSGLVYPPEYKNPVLLAETSSIHPLLSSDNRMTPQTNTPSKHHVSFTGSTTSISPRKDSSSVSFFSKKGIGSVGKSPIRSTSTSKAVGHTASSLSKTSNPTQPNAITTAMRSRMASSSSVLGDGGVEGLTETRRAYPFLKSRKCEYCMRTNPLTSTQITMTTTTTSSTTNKSQSQQNNHHHHFTCQFCHRDNIIK